MIEPIPGGTDPPKLLFHKDRDLKFEQLAIEFGKLPDSWLLEMSTTSNLHPLANVLEGMLPVRLFFAALNRVSFSIPSHTTFPVNWF